MIEQHAALLQTFDVPDLMAKHEANAHGALLTRVLYVSHIYSAFKLQTTLYLCIWGPRGQLVTVKSFSHNIFLLYIYTSAIQIGQAHIFMQVLYKLAHGYCHLFCILIWCAQFAEHPLQPCHILPCQKGF